MTSKEIEDKLKSIIEKVAKLGWVQTTPEKEPYMHLADVEKTIIALFDEFEMYRIDKWVLEAEKDGTACKELPDMKIPSLSTALNSVESQRRVLAPLMKGERCVYRICPFFKQEVPSAAKE